ncbi:MAG TPA: DUF3048 C-terminal domain-containing protein [Anaerolineales bacterium]|nr:DUF3048 C-terminal domain-containing protein [Anaerolineales bacterium]
MRTRASLGRRRWIGLSLVLFLAACQFPATESHTAPVLPTDTPYLETEQPLIAGTSPFALEPSATPTSARAEPTLNDAATEPQPTPTPSLIGPGYVRGVNPLTGLPAADPQALTSAPLLVSIANFPPSARPQAGVSVAAQVWETYIGEGMTRWLAVYYGDYVQNLEQILANRLAEGSEQGFVIGPVRSGRVVYEDIKTLFPNAKLLIAGASAEVAEKLTNRSSVYGSDPNDINSAGLQPQDLRQENLAQVDPAHYASLTFGDAQLAGCQEAPAVRIVYNYYNHVGWQFDPARGAYLRSQDKADGTGQLFPANDRLSGEQLAFENVVVLFAQHRFVTNTIIEMELLYVKNRRGLLFRDGLVCPVKWSSLRGKLQFHSAQGTIVPLKPGPSFFEVVSNETSWNAEKMEVRFHTPPRP